MRQLRLLQRLPTAERARLLERARHRTYAAGDIVFQEGDAADSLHIIVKGRVLVSVTSPDGRELTFAVLGEDDVFGELALIAGEGQRESTVRALEPTETLAVPRRELHGLRQRHQAGADLLIEILGDRLLRQTAQLEEALYLPVQTRILRRLVELAQRFGDGERPAVIPLTQEDIAGLAGTARATVNRILRMERNRGTISLEKKRITVLHLDALVRRARLVRGTVDLRPMG